MKALPALAMFALSGSACDVTEEDASNALPTEQAPVPFVSIDVPTPIAGATQHIVAFGTLGEGERVFFARSRVGTAGGPCFPSAGGLCIDLQAPSLAGTALADANGDAILTVTIPPGATGRVYYQAVVIRGARGHDSMMSGTDGGAIQPPGSGGPGTDACAIRQAEHPTYTTPAQDVALCGNTYQRSNMDSACAPGWQVCTLSQWNARYPVGQYPGGTLSSFGDLQSGRMTGTWNAMAPSGTNLWDCDYSTWGCLAGYNPWNSGKYLYDDTRTDVLKGSGSCCSWDSSFQTTSDIQQFAVYCCSP